MARAHHATHIGHINIPSGWSMAAHSHDRGHELVLVTEGEIETVMEGRTTLAGAGVIKFHPREVTHAERATRGLKAHLICLSWVEADGCDYLSWPRLVSDRTGRIRALMEWMVELSPPADAEAERTRDALLQALIFAYAGAEASPSDAMVLSVRDWTRKNLAKPIYLDDLAAVAGLSRFHFNRLFRRATGKSPMQFVRALRVDAARSLLLGTDRPLREIAPEVGFVDEFQLSRVFREVTGQSPASLRRRRA